MKISGDSFGNLRDDDDYAMIESYFFVSLINV